jgi:biotin carboxyl carrier protein
MPAREKTTNQDQGDAATALQIERDHDAIARLADDLLPALIAKLAASGLGEIEVRQGGWKVRLRMPATIGESPRDSSRAADAQTGHGHTSGRTAAGHSRPDERDRRQGRAEEAAGEPSRIVAKSPAVGVYNPRKDLAVGMRVRSGDRIGFVNVLGVNQDVISPVDGVIGSSLAEAGEAVEYGQELVRIELPERVAAAEGDRSDREPAVAGKA